jgi:hemerythrin-like domain-containing protein
MSTDAIVLLKEDHKQVKAMFRKFEAAGDGAHAQKGAIVDRIIELLTVHTYIENEVMYPQVRRLLPDLEDDVLESYEEHHVADVLCAELAAMDPTDERFDAKTTVLIENVTHHIEEEERDWFPAVRDGLGRKQLAEIGRQLIEARRRRRAARRSPVRSRRSPTRSWRSAPSKPGDTWRLPVTEYRSDTVVNAEPAALFAWLSDVNNLPRYMSQLTSARALTGGEVAVAAHIETPDGERDVQGRATFDVDKANRRITWSSEGDNHYRGELSVASDEDGSRLMIALTTERAAAAGMGGEIQQELTDTVDRVRSLVEPGDSPVVAAP